MQRQEEMKKKIEENLKEEMKKKRERQKQLEEKDENRIKQLEKKRQEEAVEREKKKEYIVNSTLKHILKVLKVFLLIQNKYMTP